MMIFEEREDGVAESLIHLEMITNSFVLRDCFIPARNNCVFAVVCAHSPLRVL